MSGTLWMVLPVERGASWLGSGVDSLEDSVSGPGLCVDSIEKLTAWLGLSVDSIEDQPEYRMQDDRQTPVRAAALSSLAHPSQ